MKKLKRERQSHASSHPVEESVPKQPAIEKSAGQNSRGGSRQGNIGHEPSSNGSGSRRGGAGLEDA